MTDATTPPSAPPRRPSDPFAALRRAEEQAAKARQKQEEAARRLAEAEAEIGRLRRADRSRARAALGGALMGYWAVAVVEKGATPEALMSGLSALLTDQDRARVLDHLRDEVAAVRRRQASASKAPPRPPIQRPSLSGPISPPAPLSGATS